MGRRGNELFKRVDSAGVIIITIQVMFIEMFLTKALSELVVLYFKPFQARQGAIGLSALRA